MIITITIGLEEIMMIMSACMNALLICYTCNYSSEIIRRTTNCYYGYT